MVPLTQEAMTELSINFLFYFIIGSFGAFLKDLYETLTKKNERVRLGEILIGGTSATFICYGLQDSWMKDSSINFIVLVTFMCGILGFEIFGNMTSLNKVKKAFEVIFDFKNRIRIQYKPPVDKVPPIDISEIDNDIPLQNDDPNRRE